MKIKIDIDHITPYYDISENGVIYSKIKKRNLRPSYRNGYQYVYITPLRLSITIHKLVALRYLGTPASMEYEVNHIDRNRSNNCVSNLEWVTHKDNVRKSFACGRKSYWKGKKRGSYSDATKAKMALAKNKRVLCDGVEYPSIESVLPVIRVTRHTFNRHISSGVIKGHEVRFVDSLTSLDSGVYKTVVTPHPVTEPYTLSEIEANYDIYPDGKIFSKKSQSFLKPVDTGLSMVHNIKVKWYNVQLSAARLVALKHVPAVAGKREVGHIDNNYYNNDASNLVWQSRSETRLKGNNTDYWWRNNVKPVEL